ncbi:lipopolysaccharide biosynthesis protein [Mucilaginibacter ginkgonis]|uniref:Oligosaccharide flippase family protein n=1 Tax=Mucilaginibacter ginkgonis TaxID=2682091 RepID=A0A6I4I320_9SPHI|nr:oligosaccharide flippase family protein [Mucilaginibacter ginkgonis]QQL50886.1 oligosaccharide flippase family protein [Mucilaginibacter ginkgonis]
MWQKVLKIIKNKHLLSLVGNGVMSLLGMITTAIIYRYLDKAEAGKWVFFLSTLLLIDNIRSGFLTTAFIKFYAGSEQRRKIEIAGSTWAIGIGITGVLLLLNIPAIGLSDYVKDEGLLLFFHWFGVTYICTLPMFIASCVVQGELRFDRLLYLRICNQGLYISFIITLIVMRKLSLHTVLFSYMGAAAITSAFALVMRWTRFRTLFKFTRKGVAEIFNFGKYSVGTTLSSNMFGTSDAYIINFMLGPAALAIYNLGQSLMQLVEIPLRSFAASGMPVLSEAYNVDDRNWLIYTMKKYAGMLTVLLIPVVILAVIFADFAISLIGGGKYVHTEAANVFRLFMTFALLYPADRFFALSLDVIHRPQVNFYKVLIMLAANIIFDFAGVAVFKNVYGIAISTVFPVLIAVIVGYWYMNKYQKFSFWDTYVVGFNEAKLFVKNVSQGKSPFRS